ncbi:MAG: ATP-dependent DNA helicase, partial [Candidatus Methanomethylophilaceae archaeon]|nr:ATP-dependent DNA helicase [Candidatus Methanomethylophilaceae archaeon]
MRPSASPAAETAMGKTSEHPFMPYVPRGCQDDIIGDIARILDDGRHIVLESGTGTGKTIVSLAGALEHARPRGKRIIYATRTVSQSDQVMRELKAIRRIAEVSGIVVTGRGRSCPRMRGIQGMDSIPPHVQYAMCREMRRTGKCALGQSPDPALMERLCGEDFPASGDFDRICGERNLCPYEARRSMLGRTDVVAVPYAYVLSREIREHFLAGVSNGDPSGIVLIIDEAHNFAEHAREFESFNIDSKLVKSAMESCKDGREIATGIPMKEFIGAFWDRVRSEATENIGLGQSEHMFGREGPEAWVMRKFSLDRHGLEDAISRMTEMGEAETAAMIENGKPGASPIELLGVKLGLWCDGASERYVRSVRVDPDGEYLRAACIDIADVSGFLRSIPGAVHMSGTLHPL